MTENETAERAIELILVKMDASEVDQLAPDQGEFGQIAKAVMAWYQLLMESRIVRRMTKAQEVLASSLVVLGTLVKYTYALGRRRGRRDGRRS